MADCTVEVTPLLLGSASATLPPPVAFHYHSETISVRELIQRVVTCQIQILQAQQAHGEHEIQAILARQYLADEEVSEQAADGAVKMPSVAAQNRYAPDPAQEVQRALRGFEAGRFFITVNGFQPEFLDQHLLLSEHSQVLFLRLTPLVGG